jgi:hypothetical protein
MTREPRVVVIVPWRGGEGIREASWGYVRRQWQGHADWPIFTGGAQQHGRFNRAKAKNEGVRLAGAWDVAIMLDADILPIDFAQVDAAIAKSVATGHVVVPFDRYSGLTEQQTYLFLYDDAHPLPAERELVPGYVGGCVVVPRAAWNVLGGYDEGFDSWGGEDNAFFAAAATLVGWNSIPGEVIHLWHTRGAEADLSHPLRQKAMARDDLYFAASKKPRQMRSVIAQLHAEKPDNAIPQILHQIWVGPRPVPIAWAKAWEEKHPGWECRIWREPDLANLDMPNRAAYESFLARGIWHGAADIARIAILGAYGGVYVDIDSQPLIPLTGAPFMRSSFFAGREPVPSLPGRLANGCIGSVAGHPILDTWADLISRMPSLDEPWDTTGGTSLTAAVLVHRQCCKPMVMSERTFHLTDYKLKPVAGADKSYIRHYWATTNDAYSDAGTLKTYRVVVLTPRRADAGRRDRIWEFVKEWWGQAGWPIYEGHHEEGRFNASAARNRAASAAGEWDVAVFVDADTVVFDFDLIRKAVDLAAKTNQFVRPYSDYLMVDEGTSDAVMANPKRPSRGYRRLGEIAHGGVHVVSRSLWNKVGGYDERFSGWGSEDTAFERACVVLAGYKRINGQVYHLWHPPSADRNPSDPGFQANVALRHRYEIARRPPQMQALLDERRAEPVRVVAESTTARPRIGLVVITDGRRDCISRTVPSLEAKVGPFDARIICDDSGDQRYADWLRDSFPEHRVLAHDRLGHARAVRFALHEAGKLDVDWIFWSEDDYEFADRIDLSKIIATMEAEGEDLKQMSIKRQAWFPAEIEAGPTVIDRFDPALFVEHANNGSSWLEHRQFFTLNPYLARRSLVAVIRWPLTSNSEHHFGRSLFRDRRVKCGIWGAKADPPLAIHSGERVGVGY